MAKSFQRTMAYLAKFEIDAGSVARTGVSPEGYYSPTGTTTQLSDSEWTVDKGWTLWPASFDYNEFQKCIWADEMEATR